MKPTRPWRKLHTGAYQFGDMTVAGHLAMRNFLYGRVYCVEECFCLVCACHVESSFTFFKRFIEVENYSKQRVTNRFMPCGYGVRAPANGLVSLVHFVLKLQKS